MEHKLLTLSPPRDQKPYRLISSQLLFFCRVCGSCSFHSFKSNLCTWRFTAWETFSLTQLSWAHSFLPASSGKIDPWSAQSRILQAHFQKDKLPSEDYNVKEHIQTSQLHNLHLNSALRLPGCGTLKELKVFHCTEIHNFFEVEKR